MERLGGIRISSSGRLSCHSPSVRQARAKGDANGVCYPISSGDWAISARARALRGPVSSAIDEQARGLERSRVRMPFSQPGGYGLGFCNGELWDGAPIRASGLESACNVKMHVRDALMS